MLSKANLIEQRFQRMIFKLKTLLIRQRVQIYIVLEFAHWIKLSKYNYQFRFFINSNMYEPAAQNSVSFVMCK